jgi:hypothetical protein
MTMVRQKVITEASVNISDRARETDVSISTVAAQSAALAEGIYHITSTVDCFIKIATTANDVTTSTGYLLLAYNTVAFRVPDQYKVGVIAATTGTLYIHKVH